MFRTALAFLLLSLTCLRGADGDKAVVGTVQKLFDAMAAKDTASIRALILPGIQLVAIRPDGQASVMPVEKFAESIGAAKDLLVEKMRNPKVMIQGRIATLWAPYDFHRAGTLMHCGIDAVSLVQVGEEWKIAAITYTVEQSGCPAK